MERLLNIVNLIRSVKNQNEFKELNSDMDLRNDLGFSSLDLAEFTVRIEDEFDVDIFAGGLVNTIGDVQEILLKSNV